MMPPEPTRIFSFDNAETDKPAVPASDLGYFDVNEFMLRTNGNVQLCQELVNLFIQSGPEYIAEIQNALTTHDIDGLYRSAHKLKGGAETMALPRLTEKARAIEAAAHSEDLESAAAILPELLEQLALSIKVLQETFITAPR